MSTTPNYITNENIDVKVGSHIYFEQSESLSKQNQDTEVEKRVKLESAAYGILKYFLD